VFYIHGDDSESVIKIKDSELPREVRDLLDDAEDLLWVLDEDEPLALDAVLLDLEKTRRVLVRHRCRKVNVTVQYNGLESVFRVSPSRKFKAVIRKTLADPKFEIDPTSAADLELRIPGTDEALDASTPIGRYVRKGKCELVLILVVAVRHAG
jgi:hypothetical protein